MNEQKNTWAGEERGTFESKADELLLAFASKEHPFQEKGGDESDAKPCPATWETALTEAVTPAEGYCSLMQLGVSCELEHELLEELVDNKVIYADGPDTNLFSSHQRLRLQVASRLIKTLELDASTVAIALVFAERIERLKKRSNWLKLACMDEQNTTLQ